MPPYDSLTIANYFISRAIEQGEDGIDPLKLQKLVYNAHGWHLALTDRPLINESVEAWRYGPVIPSLYQKFKSYGSDPVDLPGEVREWDGQRWEPEVPLADQATIALLDRIWETYGTFSGVELSTLSHKPGSPWEETWREAQRDGITYSRDIPESRIRDYFASLAAQPA